MTAAKRGAIWGLALWVLGLAGAWAQGLPIAPEGLDLRAVGRVNVAGYDSRAMCSGTLIAPDRVLTAAHCVFRGDRPVRLEDLHFVAGWARGEAVAHRRVAEVIVHEDAYVAGRLRPAYDLAMLVLDSPISEVAPRRLSDFDGGAHGLAGYQATRPHLIGARLDCQGETRRARAAFSTCRVMAGSSGGPALVETAEGWAVWGVISAVNAEGTLVAVPGDWAERD